MKTRMDAQVPIGVLDRLVADAARSAEGWGLVDRRAALGRVLGQLQSVGAREAYDEIMARGIPRLVEAVDTMLDSPVADDDPQLILFALKVVALYQASAGIDLLAKAARRPVDSKAALWAVVFQAYGDDHPLRAEVLERLREPLPTGEIGRAYLEFANARARAGELGAAGHPFDTSEGHAALRLWLSESGGSAADAATALAFVAEPIRNELLAPAMGHELAMVRREGAWAAARSGNAQGIDVLAQLCLDVDQSLQARLYLQELERDDAVPIRAREPNFEAMAKMVDWLAHPAEYGRAPDDIALADTRELLWPPTSDVRRLWVFRYRYNDSGPNDGADEGYGLVGSITFSLPGLGPGTMTPEDVYALHCCWELQVDRDPRAPAERTVDAGRKLLGWTTRIS